MLQKFLMLVLSRLLIKSIQTRFQKLCMSGHVFIRTVLSHYLHSFRLCVPKGAEVQVCELSFQVDLVFWMKLKLVF